MKETLLAMLILTSWAQDEGDESVEPAPFRHVIHVRTDGKVSDVTVEVSGAVRPLFDKRTVVVARENFDRWLFDDRASERERWAHLDRLLSVRINIAARTHKLTHPQQAKLRLAGRGDIKRFFDYVEDARNDFEVNRVGLNNGLAALHRLKPLSKDYDLGPFDDGSLFAKTLHRIVVEQKAGK